MNANPYLIDGPALISFSGGRTSAFMLHEILVAYGGGLPPDVHVTFANTGKEREETLRFVHECATRWGLRVYWLERAPDGGFVEVGYNSASRLGEPFAALIAKKKYLPNAVARFCTVELKIRVMRDFGDSLGWRRWNNIVGLRYDEGVRVMKALDRNDADKERFKAVMPLSRAHVTKRDVMAFWAAQPFDLGLLGAEGNCDLCFLKGRDKLAALMRRQPGASEWWAQQEETVGVNKASGSRFVTEYSYRSLQEYVDKSPTFFDADLLDSEHDAECGLYCAGDS